MRFVSLKAASVYMIVSLVLYAYQFTSLWGVYYDMTTQKPVFPTLHYLNQTILNPVNIFMERNILVFLLAMILIPVLNILSLIIAAYSYKKTKKKDSRSIAALIIVVAILPWIIHFFMVFFRQWLF